MLRTLKTTFISYFCNVIAIVKDFYFGNINYLILNMLLHRFTCFLFYSNVRVLIIYNN